MSSTLVEVTRASHEEIERLERLIVKDLLQKEPASSHQRLFQSHRVRNTIESITSTTHKLVDMYQDKDNARKDEIAALGSSSGQSLFTCFYDRIKEIHEYHRRHPEAVVDDYMEEEPHIEFSGEEGYGRYLDLHQLYNEYINSNFGNPIDYSSYLDVFLQLNAVPPTLKLTRAYRAYLEHLLEYLINFFQRIDPLQDIARIFSKVETEFEQLNLQGLENNGPVIDLHYYRTVEELMEVGPEKLKEALAALGLKTGGTIKQRAERLFLTKITPVEQLDKRHFPRGGPTQKSDSLKQIFLIEAKVMRISEFLRETIVQTRENVVRKQALVYEEMEVEREEEEVQADTESDDDDDQQIYNPLNLPTGWDGKPIPYWLYKLHGLRQEFKCEICGNHTYWGPREFQRHFKEWRHQHGMRCLGIPNTNNFNEITSIDEARQLWEKIQDRQRLTKWRPELEEEYEDKEGNIYNKKTYTDLQRQEKSNSEHAIRTSTRRGPSGPEFLAVYRCIVASICNGPLFSIVEGIILGVCASSLWTGSNC